MTQEEKDLLLKDLCARLPYGVIAKIEVDGHTADKSVTPEFLSSFWYHIEYVQPYLRPMSSMTDEEKSEWYSFMEKYQGIPDDTVHIQRIKDYQDWLNEHHFDYRGLIEKGLAIEAPEGMYKTE